MAAVVRARVFDHCQEFEPLAALCRAALLEVTPVPFALSVMEDWAANEQIPENGNALDAVLQDGANVYAIWTRAPAAALWAPRYVGQREAASCRTRLREHLFRVDPRTASKLALVQAAVRDGNQIGITTILVRPDELRTAIEQWIIGRTTAADRTALPWNNHGR